MTQEGDARTAVQALIPDDEILDVALTYPRGFTKAQGAGLAIGGAAGMGAASKPSGSPSAGSWAARSSPT